MSTSPTHRPLLLYVVTDHPIDFPDKFVVRIFKCTDGKCIATDDYGTFDTIQEVRNQMAMHGLVRLPRHPGVIVRLISLCGQKRDAPQGSVKLKPGTTEENSIGQWIRLGAPTKPDGTWECGTDIVWPVLGGQFIDESNPPYAYVCRHMIDAGD